MAAPTPTARGTPAGIKLWDGHSTKITFASNTTISLWEKGVKPPGLDGGTPIETTTMHNSTMRTMAPRSLKTLTDSVTKCAYDPNLINLLYSQVNVRDTITVTFSDGSTLAFFGYLQKFEPDELQEGTFPTASVTITPTNTDSSGAEQAPVLTSVAGT